MGKDSGTGGFDQTSGLFGRLFPAGDLLYHYRGVYYRGDRWELNEEAIDGSYRAIAAAVRQYAPETPIVCYVNPADPRQAILYRDIPWLPPLLGIGGVLMAGMMSGSIYWIWYLSDQPFPSGAKRRRWHGFTFAGLVWVVAMAFVWVLIIVGAVFFLVVFPVARTLASRSWEKTPCCIISSRITRSCSGPKHYGTEIVYRYRFRGRDYIGDRYDYWCVFFLWLRGAKGDGDTISGGEKNLLLRQSGGAGVGGVGASFSAASTAGAAAAGIVYNVHNNIDGGVGAAAPVASVPGVADVLGRVCRYDEPAGFRWGGMVTATLVLVARYVLCWWHRCRCGRVGGDWVGVCRHAGRTENAVMAGIGGAGRGMELDDNQSPATVGSLWFGLSLSPVGAIIGGQVANSRGDGLPTGFDIFGRGGENRCR
ncbi:MAG: DUF3592 domain-containing protein [Victivallales bacterium]|nr:DUF3592 domain-containing protein [Victivallales bacterium]